MVKTLDGNYLRMVVPSPVSHGSNVKLGNLVGPFKAVSYGAARTVRFFFKIIFVTKVLLFKKRLRLCIYLTGRT